MGWVVDWSTMKSFYSITQMKDATGSVVVWFVNNYFRKRGTQIK